MRKSVARGHGISHPTRRCGPILNLALLALAVGLIVGGAAACGDSAAEDYPGGQGATSASRDSDAGNSDAGVSDSDGNDQVVSYANPNGEPVDFQDARGPALQNAASIDAIAWTVEPVIRDGALEAAGTLTQNARLFEPMNGEGSAFSVYYIGHEEAMVELLPDLGPMHVWDTDATVAPTEFELAGGEFTIRAYSPLFMDVGSPSELELRVWGYDQAGQEALLSARGVNAEY